MSSPLVRETGIKSQTYDALLSVQPVVKLNTLQPQQFELNPAGLSLTGVTERSPGFLVLGLLSCNNGQGTFVSTRGNKEPTFLSQTITVPGGSSGNLQTFTLPNSALTSIVIFTLPAGVTIGDIDVKRTQDPAADFVSIVPGTQPGNAIIKVTDFYGADGLQNYLGTGVDVRFSSNNSNGSPSNYSMELIGYQYSFDYADVLVSYIDWNGIPYDLVVTKLGTLVEIPLNFIIPIPIMNPNQTNFGSIQFKVLGPTMGGGNVSYNTTYTFNVFIPCTVSFL